eukprot:5147268-Pleurochrysis_carterae.AAC.2
MTKYGTPTLPCRAVHGACCSRHPPVTICGERTLLARPLKYTLPSCPTRTAQCNAMRPPSYQPFAHPQLLSRVVRLYPFAAAAIPFRLPCMPFPFGCRACRCSRAFARLSVRAGLQSTPHHRHLFREIELCWDTCWTPNEKRPFGLFSVS